MLLVCYFAPFDHTFGTTAVPHTQVVELTATDTYLVLACDGLWDVMTDQESVSSVIYVVRTIELKPIFDHFS